MIESDWVNLHKYASQEKSCRFQPWGPNSKTDSKAFVNQVPVNATKQPRSPSDHLHKIGGLTDCKITVIMICKLDNLSFPIH